MWFLIESYFQRMEQARLACVTDTAEQRIQIDAVSFGPERISTIKGNTATIQITGVLTQEPDFFAMIWGGGNFSTSPGDVSTALDFINQHKKNA